MGFRRLLRLRLHFVDFQSVCLQTLWYFYEPKLGLVNESYIMIHIVWLHFQGDVHVTDRILDLMIGTDDSIEQ